MSWCVVTHWTDGTLEVFGPFTNERRAEDRCERLLALGHIEQATATPLQPASVLARDLVLANERAM